MRTRWIEISVGFFMVLGFLALAALGLNVSGLNLSGPGESYRVFARFENVGGLTPRSKVTLSGVQIGEVESIRIDKERLVALVALKIYPQVDYLTIDSSAQILTSGLLGEQYVGVSVGFEQEVLKDGSYIQDTQSAMVLEDMVGRFLFNKVGE